MRFILPLLFAIGTAICWGMYGPVLQNARSVAKPPEWSPFKPYVFIGIAYVVWACFGGVMGMKMKGDSYNFLGAEWRAMVWGFAAGTLGALGALSLTSAMLSGGKPLIVMPIVFGGAVSVSAAISVWRLKAETSVNPLLWAGMVAVVIGIILVASNTPHGHAPKKTESEAAQATHSSETNDVPPNPNGVS